MSNRKIEIPFERVSNVLPCGRDISFSCNYNPVPENSVNVFYEMFEIEIVGRARRWRFPAYRFVEFSREDEEHALNIGWSLWGGEAYEAAERLIFPNAYIANISPGAVQFIIPGKLDLPKG